MAGVVQSEHDEVISLAETSYSIGHARGILMPARAAYRTLRVLSACGSGLVSPSVLPASWNIEKDPEPEASAEWDAVLHRLSELQPELPKLAYGNSSGITDDR